jgi:hypothetical protein
MRDQQEPKPTQKTPQGIDIPVPKRKDVERDLRKLIAPDRSARPDDDSAEQ